MSRAFFFTPKTVTTSDFAEVSIQSCLMDAPQLAEWMKQPRRAAGGLAMRGWKTGWTGSLGCKAAFVENSRPMRWTLPVDGGRIKFCDVVWCYEN
jgi:hypothetical protein